MTPVWPVWTMRNEYHRANRPFIVLNNPGNYNRLDDADDLDDPFACEGYPGSAAVVWTRKKRPWGTQSWSIFPRPRHLHTHIQMAGRVCEKYENRRKTAKGLHQPVFT
jgi:hypothetical protein